MARRKPRRRPNAGPPPVRNARADARRQAEQPARTGRAAAPADMPQPLSLRGVLIRALVAAAIFFVYILIVSDIDPAGALPVTAIAFALMIPVGFLMDRAVYRIRLRRWRSRRGRA
ncbi:MAG: hypothetical protein AB1416_00075 [Actinomycetota bacterium]